MRPALLSLCLCLLPATGCTGYFANLARGFSGVVTSPSTDLTPMLKGIGQVCRRQGDLAYLRSRLEDPDDKHAVRWRERMTSRYRGTTEGIEARCAALDKQVAPYLLMNRALVAYAAALRALADAQTNDFQDSFRTLGVQFNLLGQQLAPAEPELGLAMFSGADAINQLVNLALSAVSEADIRRAVLAAQHPMRHILDRMDRAAGVYQDEVTKVLGEQRTVVDLVESATLPQPRGSLTRHQALLSFYRLAHEMDGEEERLRANARLYPLAVRTLRSAHDNLVQAAQKKVPAKQAFQLMQKSLRGLLYDLNDVANEVDMALRRRMQ